MAQTLIIVAGALALTGCETDSQFGETVRSNVEVAAIAPLATTVGDSDSLGDAARAVLVQQRYEQDQMIDLMRPIQTVFLPGSGRPEKKDDKIGAAVTIGAGQAPK